MSPFLESAGAPVKDLTSSSIASRAGAYIRTRLETRAQRDDVHYLPNSVSQLPPKLLVLLARQNWKANKRLVTVHEREKSHTKVFLFLCGRFKSTTLPSIRPEDMSRVRFILV